MTDWGPARKFINTINLPHFTHMPHCWSALRRKKYWIDDSLKLDILSECISGKEIRVSDHIRTFITLVHSDLLERESQLFSMIPSNTIMEGILYSFTSLD